jgi:uncharacterized protein YdaU (DUF1376 family)
MINQEQTKNLTKFRLDEPAIIQTGGIPSSVLGFAYRFHRFIQTDHRLPLAFEDIGILFAIKKSERADALKALDLFFFAQEDRFMCPIVLDEQLEKQRKSNQGKNAANSRWKNNSERKQPNIQTK